MRFRALPLLFFCCFAGQAQWPGVEFKPDAGTGSLRSRYDRATWASPESVVRDLRSADVGTRAKALRLFGYPEAEMQDVPKPDQIELRYAAIGDDATLQAIAAITVGAMAYAAVAVPEKDRWERIGTFFCWCKYEEDPLHEFVDVRLAGFSNRFWSELVLHPSGGGTGVYGKDEVHFRVHDGALRKVISFEGFLRTCPPSPCTVAARSFSGNTLVESREQFEADRPPARNATCIPYEWDDKTFRYKRAGPLTKCAKPMTPP